MLENVNKEAEINLNNQKEEIKELDNLDKKGKCLKENKANRNILKSNVEDPFNCKVCLLMQTGFISSDDEEINEDMMNHIKASQRAMESEPSQVESDSSDNYKGFDENGNMIE